MIIRGDTSDEAMVRQVFEGRSMDLSNLKRWPDIWRYYEACALPQIIDAGANIGAASVWFAKQFPKAQIVALEPEPSNYTVLGMNVKDHKMIAPLWGGLASLGAPNSMRVVDDDNTHAGTRVVLAFDGNIPAFSLNNLQDGTRGDPFLVKIDIEGAEKEVFSRNTEWIGGTPVIMVEIHDWRYAGEGIGRAVIHALSLYDRDVVIHGEHIVSISNTF